MRTVIKKITRKFSTKKFYNLYLVLKKIKLTKKNKKIL